MKPVFDDPVEAVADGEANDANARAFVINELGKIVSDHESKFRIEFQ